MPLLTPEKLQKAIEQAGTTPTALSRAIGRDKDYIRDYLIGRKRSLKADDLAKIRQEIGGSADDVNEPLAETEVELKSELPGLPVIGTIRAGAWIEAYMQDHDDQGTTIPVSRDDRFPHARQYVLAVSGDSMDLKAPDGAFALFVDFAESGLKLKPGMLAHVEAYEHGKAETTLKEVHYDDGQFILRPKSSNPIYKPMPLRGHDGIEVRVKGILLSIYNREPL